jgi:glycerol-3-phosphate acyltransferase PlsY
MERIICLLIGYIFGLFQTGYIVGRINHIDIRNHGSGNAGTTNALRVLGLKAGAVTFLGDALKAILAGLLIVVLYSKSEEEMVRLLVLYGGFGVVLGHNFPFYLKFKGGKGIAASAGIILAFDWRLGLIAMFTFIVVVALTRYVSLGSLIMMAGFLVELIIFGQMGSYGLAKGQLMELYLIGFILTAMAFYRHKANIGRLLSGTENKLGQKKSV